MNKLILTLPISLCIPVVSAWADAQALCPDKVFETNTVTGIYQGVEGAESAYCQHQIQLESGDIFRIMCSGEIAEGYFGNPGNKVSATYDVVQYWDEPDECCFRGEVIKSGEILEAIYMAADSYRKTAEQGDAKIQVRLGWMYAEGNDTPKDPTKAADWFQRAADQGNADAQAALGAMYLHGRGVPENIMTGVEWLTKAAKQSHPESQYLLGVMHMIGYCVPKDEAKAQKYYREIATAATLGNTNAQFVLSRMYESGDGVPVDPARATEWLAKAAESGHAEAQTRVSSMYDDIVNRAKWLQRAAEQGHAEAQANLSMVYQSIYRIDNTPENIEKAEEWLLKSADQGYCNGQNWLARMYRSGHGIPIDEEKAEELDSKTNYALCFYSVPTEIRLIDNFFEWSNEP